MVMAFVLLTCRLKRRIIQLVTVILIAVWVWQYLGGVSLRPKAVRPIRSILPGHHAEHDREPVLSQHDVKIFAIACRKLHLRRCAPALQINSFTNDTGMLFNWHPFLMALAFPLLMGEALLSYRAPLAKNLSV